MGSGERLGKHSPLFASPFAIFFFFFSSPKGKRRTRRAAAVCACVCVHVRVGEVDLGGLDISSRESPPTNLPPGALGHWPLS